MKLRPMSTAPRDGTLILAWHKRTGEPLVVQIWAAQEKKIGVIDRRGEWSCYASHPTPSHRHGVVREEFLAGWAPLPAMPSEEETP